MTRPLIVAAVVFASCFVAIVIAEDQVFVTPTHNGYRLDLCRTWGQGCGQEAANAFCRTQGFEAAKAFEVDPKVGAKTPTMTLGDRRICDQPHCDAFKSITCSRPGAAPPPPATKTMARAASAILGTISRTPPAATSSTPPPASSSVPPPPPSTPSPSPATPAPSAPAPSTPPPLSSVPSPGDPDEFVVVYPKSGTGVLGRFGASAAAGQLEEERPVTLKVKADGFQAVAGDFDGDGLADLALLERPNPLKPGNVDVSFLKYSAASGFTPTGQVFSLQSADISFLAVGRFLDRGHDEVLLYAPGGTASIVTIDLGLVPVQWNSKGVVVSIDADGDNIDDLLDYAEPAGTLDIVSLELPPLGSVQDRRVSAAVRQTPALGPGRRFAVGDFTGDGRKDLLIHDSTSGNVTLAQFSSKGSIAKATPVDSGWSATTMWTEGRDYDGDKRDDLLVYDPAAGQVHLARFTASGTLRDKQLVSSMQAGTLLYPGLFTGTGRASYIAMARDLKNRLVHVQFGADGKPHPDGPIVPQMKDGGILVAGNFVKDR